MIIDFKDVKIGDYLYWINPNNKNHSIIAIITNNHYTKTAVCGKTLEEIGYRGYHESRIGYVFSFIKSETQFFTKRSDIDKILIFK